MWTLRQIDGRTLLPLPCISSAVHCLDVKWLNTWMSVNLEAGVNGRTPLPLPWIVQRWNGSTPECLWTYRGRFKWKDSASSAMPCPDVKWFNTWVSVNLEAAVNGRTLLPLPWIVQIWNGSALSACEPRGKHNIMEGLCFFPLPLSGSMVQHLHVCDLTVHVCKPIVADVNERTSSASTARHCPEVKWYSTWVSVNLEAEYRWEDSAPSANWVALAEYGL